jgi:spore coat polysaccharide biosynthesis protein SpsF
MNTIAIIQARMGSTRLPGKVLRDLFGKSVLEHVITRLKKANNIDEIVVATTLLPPDEQIVEECSRLGVPVFRGSETDVLERYWQAASTFKANHIVRITSDCPLIDPSIVDSVIELLNQEGADYSSNAIRRTFPRGLDVEAFHIDSLEVAYRRADRPEQREHVTPYIYQNPQKFKLVDYVHEVDYSEYRWTLDTHEDWLMISAIYDHLYKPNEIFTWEEAIKLMLSHPELALINSHVEQKKL